LKKELKIIGRKDKADLPMLNLENISVKIDSGAYSCSIHCESVQIIEVGNKTFLEVIFLDSDDVSYTGEKFRFENYRTKKVKSSTGHQQERFFSYQKKWIKKSYPVGTKIIKLQF
jgi:hypothetical protein